MVRFHAGAVFSFISADWRPGIAGEDPFNRLLQRAAHEPGEIGALLAAAFDELRVIAKNRLRNERIDHTLQPTALVNEVYLRLFAGADVRYENRAHFFSAAAETMRHILLEHARNRGRLKRGGGRKRVPLSLIDVVSESDRDDIQAVDDALARLETRDPGLAKIVKLRFFAGLTNQEIAEALGSSERTIRREWKLAQAWLTRELGTQFDTFAE